MNDVNPSKVKYDAIEWALMHGMAFKSALASTRHVPFTLTPSLISRGHFQHLKNSVHLLGKLIHNVSEAHHFLNDAIQPIRTSGAFEQKLTV